MRVLLDTNVLISYLLPPGREPGAIRRILQAVLAGDLTLILPPQVIAEAHNTVSTKPYFRVRINSAELRAFTDLLLAVAVVVDEPLVDVPPLVRDPDDDIILAYAVLARADYLVTGDKDLLALGDLAAPLRIVCPADFVQEVLGDE